MEIFVYVYKIFCLQQTGVCIEGEIPYYTPVSLYNGPANSENHAGIFVGCIADGQSGFKVSNVSFEQCRHIVLSSNKYHERKAIMLNTLYKKNEQEQITFLPFADKRISLHCLIRILK